MISEEQKQQIINLLHEDYRDCKVEFINSRTSFIFYKIKELFKFRYFDLKHYHGALTKKIDGSYSSKFKISQIYTFNMEEETKDYYSVYVLFHELRHHYQNKFNRLGRHDIEKDCHSFAWRMTRKYHRDICDILGEKY